eukprot:532438-Pelagomonas_calceolata.AAC.3
MLIQRIVSHLSRLASRPPVSSPSSSLPPNTPLLYRMACLVAGAEDKKNTTTNTQAPLPTGDGDR